MINADDRSQTSDVATHETNRRRLLSLLGVGGVGALVGPLVFSREAHAGHDSSNTFHLGQENSAPGPTGLSGEAAAPLLSVSNTRAGGAVHPGDSAAIAASTDDAASAAITATGTGMGIFAESPTGNAIHAATDTGSALSGLANADGNGVHGGSSTTGNGVQGSSAAGNGVAGDSDTGTAGRFDSENGTALAVHGTATFSTAGSDTIPAGQDSVFVTHPVTGDSHVSVTLTSDPGPRTLGWVERASDGSGFTVHLASDRPGRPGPATRPATSLTYLVIEPAE